MSWYPGAFAHDYGGTGSCNPDSVVLHEVVNDISIPADGSPSNIAGWVSGSLACQFYADYAGSLEQFCDSRRGSSHCKDGNNHRLGIETQDDRPQTAEQSNAGSWRPAQRERLADVIAWVALTHGMPVRNMQTSRRSDIGVGYHRLGVPQIAGGHDGWTDGEVWTTSPGKPCPGNGRIAQVPGIVARAAIILAAIRAGRCGFLPPGPIDLTAALARTGTTPDDPDGWLDMGAKEEILTAIAKIAGQVNDMYTNESLPGYPYNKSAANFNDVRDLATKAKVTADQVNNMYENESLPGYPFNKSAANFNDVRAIAVALTAVAAQVTALQIAVAEITGTDVPPVIPPPVQTYTVVKGDTLHNIANRLGVSVAALQQANAITDPNTITVGAVLIVMA